MRRILVGGALAVALIACGDTPQAPPPQPPPPGAPPGERPTPGAPGAKQAPPPPVDPIKKALLDEVRKRAFRSEDFVESDANRDPFHSFLSDFSGGPSITTQYKILLPKYSLDELKLIAIVGPPTEDLHGRSVPSRSGGGYTQARAMFLDPQGTGQSILRGDHFSKADARVMRIDSEKGKVFVELKEDLGSGKTRLVERVLELHQNEPAEGPTQ
jgi:hypothetical protein